MPRRYPTVSHLYGWGSDTNAGAGVYRYGRSSPQYLDVSSAKRRGRDPQFDQKICLGIAVVTANAIRKANIAHIKAVATSHRIHWGIHHGATWVRMDEESQYIFDWHPTLDVNNPQVSKHDDWLLAQNSTNFVFFSGYD